MSIKFNNIKTATGMEDKLTFGKFINYTVEQAIAVDWEYVQWLTKNTDIPFYESVYEAIEIAKYKDPKITGIRKKTNFRGPWFYDGGCSPDSQAHFELESRSQSYDTDGWDDDIPF